MLEIKLLLLYYAPTDQEKKGALLRTLQNVYTD